MDLFTNLDLRKIALLLDVDGTIVDIGPSPAEVQIAAGLPETLKRLFELTRGALALVSGRPISDLDRLFAPLHLPAVGGHGAEMRLSDNELFFWAKPLPEDLRRCLAEGAALCPGVVVEDKG
ncbi:MAG TPA: trehalose-phosphatase, partial [Pseudolabrys sp.]